MSLTEGKSILAAGAEIGFSHFSYDVAGSAHFPQSLKSYEHFSDLGVEIAPSRRHIENVDFSRVKRSIQG